MKTAIVIPARFGSTRLPGKMLLRETGKYLVQHVYERAVRSRVASSVVIATDDPRVLAAARTFGADAVMTDRGHASGTDRAAEVARRLDADVIVNVQGDEPLIDPGHIDRLCDLLAADAGACVATLAVPFADAHDWLSPHNVKVVCDDAGRALYFSRSPVPCVRGGSPDFDARPPRFLRHLGLYAYRKPALLRLSQMPPHPLEEAEKLEQLRALALGWKIQVGLVAAAAGGVDTYEDYRRFVTEYRAARAEPGSAAAA